MMMPNTYSNNPTLFEKGTLLATLLAIFCDALGVYFIGSGFRYLIVAFLFCSVLAVFLKRLNGRLDDCVLRVAPLGISALLLCLFSFPWWTSTYNIYAYLGIPVAFSLFCLDRALLKKLLVVLLIVNLLLGLYEFLSRSYLFSNEIIRNGESIVMDMRLAGGLTGVLRVKGLFYGCLSLGLFALGMAILFSRNTLIMALCLITAVISGTRLAILMILALLLINPAARFKYRIYSLIAVVILLTVGTVLLGAYDPATLERITSVFDMGSGTHENRFLMWQCGLEQFFSYGFLHTVFGDNGLFLELYGNNPESGWITLLTDTGIVGFLLYFVPIVYLLCRFLVEKKYHLAEVLMIFFCCNLAVTFNLSMTNNLIYWICIFQFYEMLTPKALADADKLPLNLPNSTENYHAIE